MQIVRTGIGQKSLRFLPVESSKPCILGGIIFDGVNGLDSSSDGDVIYHAICNAISSLTGVPILGGIVRELCDHDGITDSQVYVEKALETLGAQKIIHVALSLEGKKPRFEAKIQEMRKQIASVLHIEESAVGITAVSGSGLTDFGCGDGVQCLCIMTTAQ